MNKKKILEVKVTQRDIKCGIPVDGFNCPISQAVKRTLNLTNRVWVDTRGIGHLPTYKMSRRAKKFILDFDAGKKVKSTTFRFTRTEYD